MQVHTLPNHHGSLCTIKVGGTALCPKNNYWAPPGPLGAFHWVAIRAMLGCNGSAAVQMQKVVQRWVCH